MSRLLRHIALFCIPLLVILASMEMLQRWLPNRYTYKRQHFEQQRHSIKTLILGNSHAYVGVDPALIGDSAFNMAMYAQSLYYSREILLNNIDQMPSLRRLLLNVSYMDLGYELDQIPKEPYAYHYAQDYGLADHVRWYDLRLYSKLQLYTFRGSIIRTRKYFFEEDSLVYSLPNGWCPHPNLENRDLAGHGLMEATLHNQLYQPGLEKKNLSYLKEMIEACQRRNIEVILFTTPVWPSYRTNLDPDILMTFKDRISNIATGNSVKWIKLDSDSRFGEMDFYDSNHLRSPAAQKFTQILKDTLDEPSSSYSELDSAPSKSQPIHHEGFSLLLP